MEELTDTESIDMSIEGGSASSPGPSISPVAADAKPSDTPSHGSFSVGVYMNSIRDSSAILEHSPLCYDSLDIGKYVNGVRSCSLGPQYQSALVIRDRSQSGRSYDSLRTVGAQEPVEDKHSIYPSQLDMLQKKDSLSHSLMTNTTLTLPLQPTGSIKRLLSPEPAIYKRRKLSSSGSDAIKNDSESRSPTDSSIFSGIYPTPALIVSNEYVEDFLNDLSDHVYKNVLENLCPDNMRGSFCRTPDVCFKQGCSFACPNFATLRYCAFEEVVPFAHFGYKHTCKGCQYNDKIDCKKSHPDGRPCRVKVVYFHIRAACITLRGGKYCQKEPCEWGHDYKEIRRKVMLTRKSIPSEADT